MTTGGRSLRLLRKRLGLTMQDVESSCARLAGHYSNSEFLIPPSRLSDIETKGIVPSIHRFYSLAVVYRQDIRELLSWYGVDLNGIAKDLGVSNPTKSHFFGALESVSTITIPVRFDPGFDVHRTANFSRMVETWGVVPLSYLEQFASRKYTYGYIGSEDLTMYPILLPGTFLQIDESRNEVVKGGWKSEYERPIYFIETRESLICCWCTLNHEEIILQPHPLSPVATKVLKYPQEAEVIGQVVGVAMRLSEWHVVNTTTVNSHADPDTVVPSVPTPVRRKAS